ncbi:MAG: hypothetical protein BWZ07_01004 [Alphaproteobacteria bacterium ADurb.BinA280]|nr:MAG: hypothetical protein BWZ07_01004 [Alphaproteobacteria bacterium ADurb.BinA280]
MCGGDALIDKCAGTAQTELIDLCIESRVARHADVGLGSFVAAAPGFGFLDASENRRISRLVLVNADAEIDLERSGVLGVGGHQAQDGIGWGGLQVREHGNPGGSRKAEMSSIGSAPFPSQSCDG